MTAQTKQEELQDMLYNNVLNFSVGEKPNEDLLFLDEAYPGEFKSMEAAALELINSEVLSAISEMKEKAEVKPVKTPVRGELVGQMFVPLEDIEDIENRYKL